MAKVITQETFDDVVKENIVEFSMSIEEAREETIKQFEAQGIHLGNIIKDLNVNSSTGVPLLNESVDELKRLAETNDADTEKICQHLAVIVEECKQSVPHRVLAAKLGAYEHIVKRLNSEEKLDEEVLLKLLTAANAIINKQPDVFCHESLAVALKHLKTAPDAKVACELLKWLQKACILHEMNRQTIMEENLTIPTLKPFLGRNEPEVIRNTCALFRYLILDDDIRVEFGKAHEHARQLAAEALTEITQLLTKFKSDPDTLSDLMLTIASLTVRNELCQTVEEAGGLKFILDAMVEFPESMKIIREACKLLKALAGNDTVKQHIVQCGAAPLLESALNRHKDNETFARHALACISTLALRDPANSRALFETGISETIIQTMKIHPTSKIIQRNGAWAVRNMVSRSRDQCDTFVAQGIEDVLNQALTDHPSIAHDVKSALRDLGCKVHLNEEWKATSEIQIKND
ncbi:armadillo repeat-containing protein 6 homolog [Anopheles gambiae]|uniref:Armadillo repeat-containing protein 6 homolog n=1 Tax=Anopheles coluzzii TaxID=1518534 RepID=A0A6E8VQU6_ANOCL|nr:armadillo repeat-containing protein 6 homolog [Anopheles coluzzii]XP_316648.4 armadillo repeat-containing protein 6 homolog [Anopheles gambiae]